MCSCCDRRVTVGEAICDWFYLLCQYNPTHLAYWCMGGRNISVFSELSYYFKPYIRSTQVEGFSAVVSYSKYKFLCAELQDYQIHCQWGTLMKGRAAWTQLDTCKYFPTQLSLVGTWKHSICKNQNQVWLVLLYTLYPWPPDCVFLSKPCAKRQEKSLILKENKTREGSKWRREAK